jgi:hypothetical protein
VSVTGGPPGRRPTLRAVIGHRVVRVRDRDDCHSSGSYLAQMAQWSMWFGGDDRDSRDSGSLAMILGIIRLPIAAMLGLAVWSFSRKEL